MIQAKGLFQNRIFFQNRNYWTFENSSINIYTIFFYFVNTAELFILYTYLYWEYAQPSIQSIINPTQLFFNSKFLQFQQFHPSIIFDNAPRILNEIHFLNWNLRKPVLLLENLFSNRRH